MHLVYRTFLWYLYSTFILVIESHTFHNYLVCIIYSWTVIHVTARVDDAQFIPISSFLASNWKHREQNSVFRMTVVRKYSTGQ